MIYYENSSFTTGCSSIWIFAPKFTKKYFFIWSQFFNMLRFLGCSNELIIVGLGEILLHLTFKNFIILLRYPCKTWLDTLFYSFPWFPYISIYGIFEYFWGVGQFLAIFDCRLFNWPQFIQFTHCTKNTFFLSKIRIFAAMQKSPKSSKLSDNSKTVAKSLIIDTP